MMVVMLHVAYRNRSKSVQHFVLLEAKSKFQLHHPQWSQLEKVAMAFSDSQAAVNQNKWRHGPPTVLKEPKSALTATLWMAV